ncbi:MAG: undecaprenyl-diphosphate phosphatase [Flavobacteriales bacterium]|jgi:undecaprenyl-diphosphatase|uniref:undecaprenyl-diphosphate phosphatase n=1 Tax=Blattabacterium sp. (Mastotermes darwiniensis) TaxID=39768 RepID=UPI000231DF85|nr:undecaprenyl-diphosphate phosphatase [Blattabacterium sp. (Mastotermes darwiniensis)]AER40413.1 undecaprenyl-diphosphatase [Blattabacterium sp. (Mastotermes darwiniensis) str. MADAR]MDR1804864.1 undecaprenyl-diphosphate phosphatase [Flavobacteriales bacterium]
MNYIQSILLGIIEGITEFFPISSTGHMILASSLMGILNKRITKLFLISVQLGAVFSVVLLYRKKFFFQKLDFYLKIFIASFPIGLFGFFFNSRITFFLENPLIVAISLLIGGLVILKAENYYEKNFSKKKNHNLTYFKAFIIGLFQCLSLIPGVSRSAATITSCMLQNIERKKAIEFSFFLSIPVIVIATCKKLMEHYFPSIYLSFSLFDFRIGFLFSKELILQEIGLLLIGNIIAFITGIISIKCFMSYIERKNFKLFGYYRIILGFFFIVIHYLVKPIGND